MPNELLEVYNAHQDEKRETLLLSVTDETIEAMRSRLMGLSCAGLQDKDGLAAVSAGRKECVRARNAIENTRKEMKAEVLERGRKIDSEAKRLTALLQPIEAYLAEQEDRVKAEIKRIEDRAKEESHQERMKRLAAAGIELPEAVVRTLNGVQFEQEFQRAAEAKRVADIAAKQLEAQRAELEKLRAEQEERRKADAERLKAEQERIAAERAELDRQRREQAAEAERIRQAQIVEQQRIAEEQAKLRAEQAAKEAAERAARETEARLHQQELDRIKAEELAQARKSDVEKIRQIASDFKSVKLPDVESEWARDVVEQIRNAVDWIGQICSGSGE